MTGEEQWLESARKDGFKVLAIVLDLEEKDQFPMFFQTWNDYLLFQKNVISEWKIKIIKVHDLF